MPVCPQSRRACLLHAPLACVAACALGSRGRWCDGERGSECGGPHGVCGSLGVGLTLTLTLQNVRVGAVGALC